jgi:hypothetical protein
MPNLNLRQSFCMMASLTQGSVIFAMSYFIALHNIKFSLLLQEKYLRNLLISQQNTPHLNQEVGVG